MDVAQFLGALLGNSLQNHANGQKQQNGQYKRKEPTGVIPFSLGNNERLEARYWENPIKDSAEIRIGYSKPRIQPRENEDDKSYFAYQLRHAFADIEATYRVCERALQRHEQQAIALTEADRTVAEKVVATFGDCFDGPEAALPNAQTMDLEQLRRLLAAGS